MPAEQTDQETMPVAGQQVVSIQDLLQLLGQKEVELTFARQQITAYQQELYRLRTQAATLGADRKKAEGEDVPNESEEAP